MIKRVEDAQSGGSFILVAEAFVLVVADRQLILDDTTDETRSVLERLSGNSGKRTVLENK